ncbi:MAG: trigger factor [Deltaproteobacteria bacterium]|jgi:trigger factor|nr:trigger factor [Deltaproteobacteria bacterium]
MTVKTSVETENEVTKNIKIEIPRSTFDEQVAKKLGTVAGRIQLKGFRKGKVPKNYVGKLYGDELKYDVLNDFVQEHYRTVIDNEKLKIVGFPDLDFDQEAFKNSTDNIQVTAKVSLFPNPEITNYKGIKINVELEQVKDEDLESQLKSLQSTFSTFKELSDRNFVELGDVVKIDYKGSLNGKELADLCGADIDIELKENSAPEHLINGLIGMQVGSVKEISLQVPEGIKDDSLVGKTIVYQVTVKAIQEKVLAELNDELAQKSQKAQTLVELKKVLREELELGVEERNRELKLNKILEEIAKANPFLIPQKLVDEEIRQILIEWGVFKRDDEKVWTRDVSMFREKLGEQAEKKVRNYVILNRVKEVEGLTATDDDVEAWFDKQTDKFKLEKERLKEYYERDNDANFAKRIIENNKTIELLIGSAEIN